MENITIFGQEYDKNNLPEEIILECGCVYENTHAEVGIGYIGKVLCSDHDPTFTINEAKVAKITQMNNFIQNHIYASYSREKQFNIFALIDRATETDKTTMIDFINATLTKQETLKTAINALTVIGDVYTYDVATEFASLE